MCFHFDSDFLKVYNIFFSQKIQTTLIFTRTSLFLHFMLYTSLKLYVVTQGSAEVVFARRSDAFQALKRYNNVQLDGKPMKIEIMGVNADIPISARMNVVGRANGKRTVTMAYVTTIPSNFLDADSICIPFFLFVRVSLMVEEMSWIFFLSFQEFVYLD